MSTAIRLGAMAMAALVVLSVAAPAVATEPADIEFSAGNTSFTVTVTHNGTPVNDTLVNVTPTDPANVSYAGDSGLTDANGTVTFDLPANETEVNISATVNGTESSITVVLPASGNAEPTWDGQGPFGQWVSKILRGLGVDSGTPLGQQLSELVVKNNPGSEHRSDKANPGGNGGGPPDHATNQSEQGDNASASGNGSGNGPPDHAAGNSSDEGNTTTTGNSGNNGNGNDNANAGGNDKGGDKGKAKGKDG